MYINTYNFTGNWQESDMCPPPPPHLGITPRTRDFSPVLLTILIEYNSAFKTLKQSRPPPPPPSRPSENNDIRFFFNLYLMQYYLAIKAQIVVPEVSYRRFVQKRNLDVKRQLVTVPCVTSKYSKNVSYINVY